MADAEGNHKQAAVTVPRPAGSQPPPLPDKPSVGALPNLIVIGAMKCGTSSLHYYLSLHPEIAMSRLKELNFFTAEHNWSRGLEWYMQNFDPGAKVRGESSPTYTTHPQLPGVPERMASVVPDAKLIYVVRDPLERIAAQWVHEFERHTGRAIEDAISDSSEPFISRSRYHLQLTRFLEHFAAEQILVVDHAELLYDRRTALQEVFAFLEVDADYWNPKFNWERNASARKRRHSRLGLPTQKLARSRLGPKLPHKLWLLFERGVPVSRPIAKPDVRAALGDEAFDVLREDAAKLRELTGREFSSWTL